MSLFSEGEQLLGEAEKAARAHPQQADKALEEVEHVAEKETGGRYDSEIQGVGTRIEQEFGGPDATKS